MWSIRDGLLCRKDPFCFLMYTESLMEVLQPGSLSPFAVLIKYENTIDETEFIEHQKKSYLACKLMGRLSIH